eukprot:2810705-Pyramimonas_sp.AAC.1
MSRESTAILIIGIVFWVLSAVAAVCGVTHKMRKTSSKQAPPVLPKCAAPLPGAGASPSFLDEEGGAPPTPPLGKVGSGREETTRLLEADSLIAVELCSAAQSIYPEREPITRG